MFNPLRMTAIAALLATAGLAQADSAALDGFRALSAVEVSEAKMSAVMKPVDVADAASAAKGVLRPGDRIAFEISGVKGTKVYILNMDATGTIQMIYPNKFVEDGGAAQAQDVMTVPAEGANYEFEVSGDGGSEIVKVIAVEGDSMAFDALIASLFDQEKAFPRALQPAAKTTDALTAFFEATGDAKIRDPTLEYVIAQ
ncbi:DUF4384 domain-containing protein [Roseovarius spongiae]|uniref:DUF4384 domain-containing protein n=1 Tax=Roseovarius spongiae TaxID=2320272 RepID=A0A3A8B4U2_9RHOB|nr:DUF4384 domain-containing protein [Roseovarius spongiae]RKF13829.1 DUF4384 domain-containing protein [Roseovarius spongiae]